MTTMANAQGQTERPSSWATLKAYFREGLHTVQDFFLKAFPDSTPVKGEPGTLGQPTPQMVTQDIQGPQSYDQRLGDYVQRGNQQTVHQQDRQRVQ